MPKVIKKRAVKKKPIQEDEVKSTALQAIAKIKERQKLVITGVLTVLVLVVLIVIYSTYSSSLTKEAYSIETEAYNIYYGESNDETMSEEDKWKKALELFQESIDIKPSPSTQFYLGNCYFNLGDFESAIKEYNVFVNKFRSAKGLLPIVYQKLAATYFKTAQNDKAIETLQQLAKVEYGSFKDTAMVLEARYYESAGDSEKAQEKYRELSIEFPNSVWSGEAGSKIASEEAKRVEAASKESAEKAGDAEPVEEQQKKPAEKPAAQ